jgi:hypothetical protein
VPGAALHYLDARTGIKDFDVWSFYAARSDRPFPYRWRGTADYGPSKFGRYQMTRRHSQAVVSICSGDRSTCRSTPNRPQSSVSISLQRTPAPRKNWWQRRSCSSAPSSLSLGSSGLGPALRNDIIICRWPSEAVGQRLSGYSEASCVVRRLEVMYTAGGSRRVSLESTSLAALTELVGIVGIAAPEPAARARITLAVSQRADSSITGEHNAAPGPVRDGHGGASAAMYRPAAIRGGGEQAFPLAEQ